MEMNTFCGHANLTRIWVVFGTRPEVIKLFPVINELLLRDSLIVRVISSGQHEGMMRETIEALGINIWKDLHVMSLVPSLGNLTSKVISGLESLLTVEKPDLIIVQGDTTTAFCAALVGFYHKIDIAHVEAGLRTGDLYAPFPEEFNRKVVDMVTKYYFAPTKFAQSNLLREGISPKKVYVSGNTVVDAAQWVLNHISPSKDLEGLENDIHTQCHDNCRIILLTTHRRENIGRPMVNIFIAARRILEKYANVVIVFPMHQNPAIKKALVTTMSATQGRNVNIEDVNTLDVFGPRFHVVPPMKYIDWIHLMKASNLLLTDSGGIQEEGASIGIPIVILRNSTERPEAVMSGRAVLAGTDIESICAHVEEILADQNRRVIASNVFGDGSAGRKIVDTILEDRQSRVLDNVIESNPEFYDLVIVLTVWRRSTLALQLERVLAQSALQTQRAIVIVFQNGQHINVSDVIQEYEAIFKSRNITFRYMMSILETGYFGRFLIPLTINVNPHASFIINDDDVLFGDMYYENMLRVVQEGSLCTQNGRIFSPSMKEKPPNGWVMDGRVMTFEHDYVCDFGGHIWTGEVAWLRNVWQHPPDDISNCEDAWISIVLKTQFEITTKIPKCPAPVGTFNYNTELCSCSIDEAFKRVDGTFGQQRSSHSQRQSIMASLIKRFDYKLLLHEDPAAYEAFRSEGVVHPHGTFNESDWRTHCRTWMS